MSEHSVADARNNLSDLIERVVKGEAVIITRHGKPVVELKPVQPPPRRVTQADLDWLRTHRVPVKPGPEDAATLVRHMRDEDWR